MVLFENCFFFVVVVFDTVLRYFDHEKALEENMEENVHACKGEEWQEELRRRETMSACSFVCPMGRTTEMFKECKNCD